MNYPDTRRTAFDTDIESNGGYRYTTNASLSSKIANERQTEVVLSLIPATAKTMIDIGCGDGTYTNETFERSNLNRAVGVDISQKAILSAKRQFKRIKFYTIRGEMLDYPDDFFDVGILRGVLHHCEYPGVVFYHAIRISKMVIVIEPNGNNLILKLIEKVSKYHREHKEKSFGPHKLRGWSVALGGKIQKKTYSGLVPFFCPAGLVKILKAIEPIVEKTPILNSLLCANYVFTVTK